MLARTADNMYWLARYVERAEYLARILEATQRLSAVPTADAQSTNAQRQELEVWAERAPSPAKEPAHHDAGRRAELEPTSFTELDA